MSEPVGVDPAGDEVRADLITTSELAELFGVSPQRVHQLSKRDDFPIPLPRGARWSKRAALEFLDGWDREPGRRAGD